MSGLRNTFPLHTHGCLIGYSDYDVFKKIIEFHGYIGVKSNSKTFL